MEITNKNKLQIDDMQPKYTKLELEIFEELNKINNIEKKEEEEE